MQECCEELEGERNDAIRATGDAMERMRVAKNNAHYLETERNGLWHQVKAQFKLIVSLEAERDEARQWARKLYKADGLHRIRYAERGCELRDLRAQLSEARNKALYDATGVVCKYWNKLTCNEMITLICSLRNEL